MPQLDTTTWPPQLFWLAITFFALYLIISRIAIPRTGGVIARRKASIEGDLAQAQRLKAETDQAIEAYEAALADARSKAQAVATENRNALSAEIDAERGKLDQALGGKVADAEKQIATARNKALADVRGVAAEIATSIVAALIGARVTKTAAADAVAKAGKQGAR
ncbi:MAG: F0F1 ATP synthase subunit B' [Rhizobiales bacterium]|nr:F0F1 ATP synthase subunit B' [Hyphomicrobiales bacterium]